jgi:hypothetical protein
MSESSWYLGKFIRRFLGQQALPPYPEDAFRLRTPYGMCLMFAFATGESQDLQRGRQESLRFLTVG